jgi:hypothetical protein
VWRSDPATWRSDPPVGRPPAWEAAGVGGEPQTATPSAAWGGRWSGEVAAVRSSPQLGGR